MGKRLFVPATICFGSGVVQSGSLSLPRELLLNEIYYSLIAVSPTKPNKKKNI